MGKKETVEQYLARGGRIEKCAPTVAEGAMDVSVRGASRPMAAGSCLGPGCSRKLRVSPDLSLILLYWPQIF